MEKALGVHCLAMRAAIPWHGDLPTPATRLEITDLDGDRPKLLVRPLQFTWDNWELMPLAPMCVREVWSR